MWPVVMAYLFATIHTVHAGEDGELLGRCVPANESGLDGFSEPLKYVVQATNAETCILFDEYNTYVSCNPPDMYLVVADKTVPILNKPACELMNQKEMVALALQMNLLPAALDGTVLYHCIP
jgi:hypothetical protein